MGVELESALSDYLTLLRESFTQAKKGDAGLGNLVVLESEGWTLSSLVEKAESEGAFGRLVNVTGEVFSGSASNKASSTWGSAVQNFFRRSGLYRRAFDGNLPEDACVCRLYAEAFTRTEIKVTYFAPLEFISFDEERMDFGDFQVQRFDRDELGARLQQATCRIFYPWASVDTELLAQYWFLTRSEVMPARELGSMKVPLDFRVKPRYSAFPRPVEEALKSLVLFPWGTASHPLESPADLGDLKVWDAPRTFGVPFCISISDSLTDHVFALPSTAGLETHAVTDDETGETLGEVPSWYLDVRKEPITPGQRTNQGFVDFVQWADTTLRRECPDYPFIDLAAGFLVKAFFSEGLEQLLWHITAIEAVLGENREGGLTRLLKSRVGLILGDNEEEQADYAKLFGRLYDFRCDLVHGNDSLTDNKVKWSHLGQAREIARSVVVWMLRYLDHLRSTLPAETAMPKRAELLAALDAAPASPLLNRLPPGFPSALGWCDR